MGPDRDDEARSGDERDEFAGGPRRGGRRRRDAEADAAQDVLEGSVRRRIFGGEAFFVILQVDVKGFPDPITVKGNLAGVSEYDDVRLRGSWKMDPRYGRQFAFVEGEVLKPSDDKGVLHFLSDKLPGVGPRRAQQILDAFGRGPDGFEGIWTVLGRTPHLLAERIPGLTPDDARRIGEDYQAATGLRDQEVWLKGLGVKSLGPRRQARILAAYKEQTRALLEADPYILMDLDGFGFTTADETARKIGVSPDHPGRARAGILHVLSQAASGEGHCYLPQGELLRRTSGQDKDALGVPAARVLDVLPALEASGKVVVEDADKGPEARIALLGNYEAERSIAEDLVARLRTARGERVREPDRTGGGSGSTEGVDLDRAADHKANAARMGKPRKWRRGAGGPGAPAGAQAARVAGPGADSLDAAALAAALEEDIPW